MLSRLPPAPFSSCLLLSSPLFCIPFLNFPRCFPDPYILAPLPPFLHPSSSPFFLLSALLSRSPYFSSFILLSLRPFIVLSHQLPHLSFPSSLSLFVSPAVPAPASPPRVTSTKQRHPPRAVCRRAPQGRLGRARAASGFTYLR